jgi:hypothetical protein
MKILSIRMQHTGYIPLISAGITAYVICYENIVRIQHTG